MEGKGGTGPNLVRPRLKHAPDLERLQDVIREGIPWTGMPRNWMLMEKEVGLVAAFVLSLGRQAAIEIEGDPETDGVYTSEPNAPVATSLTGRARGLDHS